MSDEMTTKYQQHYNQVLTGTLTDTIMKSISYQANIKLANEIIAEQEKTIAELKEKTDSVNKELENLKSLKTNSENIKISTLENTVKIQTETISKLNSELNFAGKIKNEYDTLKSQVGNVETFRNQLIKEREMNEILKQDYENQISELKEKIQNLENPPKKKKVKSTPILEILTEKEEEQQTVIDVPEEQVAEVAVRDGGSF